MTDSLINQFNLGKIKVNNALKIEMTAISENEKLARNLVACFLLESNPTIEELSDIKTAVSEAVTNSIVHGYNGKGGKIEIVLKIAKDVLFISVKDFGQGIGDIKQAMQPFYTSKPSEERSGMGFTVMESFMDEIDVKNNLTEKGLQVCMVKKLKLSE